MRDRGAAKQEGERGPRITDQFRTREGMAYELRERGIRLTLLITGNGEGDERWRVEAFSSGDSKNAVSGAASTRRDALQRMAVDWARHAPDRELPPFDWDAIARALTEVRAI